jgi:very-short-patch-repair endonuclease
VIRDQIGRFVKDHEKIEFCGSPIGNKNHLGKKHTPETILKISNSKKGTKAWNKGRKLNEFEKEKLKEYGLKGLISQQNSKEPTSIEIKLYKELETRHLLFETQVLINGKFLVDAYISDLNVIIEADGDYWHSIPRVRKKDKAENSYLKKCKYKLIRLSEKEINDGSFINLLDKKGVY